MQVNSAINIDLEFNVFFPLMFCILGVCSVCYIIERGLWWY